MALMRRKIVWAVAVAALVATPAIVGLMLVGGDESRRSAALTEPGVGGGYQLEIAGLPASGEAMKILSYSWAGSANATIGTTGLAAGKAQFGDLQVTKKIDKTSPLLFKGVATGNHFANAKLTLYRGAESPTAYMVYELTNVVITSVQHGGSADDVPTEHLSLAYEQLEITVNDEDETGKVAPSVYQYNLATAKQ
jgi:type VI secretion system secreted protein Hcp